MTTLDYWPVALVAGTGLAAWGEMRARISGLRKDVDEKESREVATAHYDEIIRRLDRIERNQNGKGDVHV